MANLKSNLPKIVTRRGTAVLNLLTADLANPCDGDGESVRKVHNNPTFMEVVVECIGPNRYSVGHYFDQNGDRMSDPEIEFVKVGDAFLAVAITQSPVGIYRQPVECDRNNVPKRFNRQQQHELAQFAELLLSNINDQQNLGVA